MTLAPPGDLGHVAYPADMSGQGGADLLRSRGALATLGTAIRVARARWRALFVVVVVVLLPALTVELVVRVVGSGDQAAVVNDRLVWPVAGDGDVFLLDLVIFLAWCVAIAGAVAVSGAGLLQVPLPLGVALQWGLRCLPLVVWLPVAMAAAVLWSVVSGPALTLVLVAVVALLVAQALGGPLSWLFAVVGLVAVGGMAVASARTVARWTLVVPAAVLSGLRGRAAIARARDLTRSADRSEGGPAVPDRPPEPSARPAPPAGPADDRRTVLLLPGLLLLAGIIWWLGMAGTHAGDRRSGGRGALLAAGASLLYDLVLTAIVALQASLIALVYLQRRRTGDENAVVDLAEVRARLSTPRPRRRASPRLMWGWVAAASVLITAPTLLTVVVVQVNPYHVPRWRLTESNLDSGVRAAQWPEDQHPIIVTDFHVVDCLDDECRRQARWGSTRVPVSTVTVGADGVVLMASLVRDVLRLERCTRAGDCARSDVAWPTGRDDAQPLVAAANTAGGAIVVATARRVRPNEVELAVARCADLACAAPRSTVLGTVPEPAPANAGQRTPYGRGPLHVRARPDGTTEVIYRGHHGMAAAPVVCTGTCAPTTPVDVDILAFSPDGAYALTTEVAPRADEVWGDLGEATPPQAQFVVARCAEPGCRALGRRWRLNDAFLTVQPHGLLVVTPDRRALVVQAMDRLTVATAKLP